MSTSTALPAAGQSLPAVSIPLVDGSSTDNMPSAGRWLLFIVYRGKHCGRCTKYLNGLERTQGEWRDAGFDIVVTSADPLEKTQANVETNGWTFPMGHSLAESDMRKLGLYVSDPLSPEENDRRFAEPGVYCVRDDGTVQIAAISNGPSARPDLAELLDGMIFTIENGKPARGMA